jgi:mannose-6-phosphate isomerase-like protein (cupin superfamily)
MVWTHEGRWLMTDAETEMSRPFVTRAGEGTAVWHLDNLKVFKAVSAMTGDRLAVWEELLPRHSSPPLHVHHHDDEAWYVLDGTITFLVDGTELGVGGGDFVWAPRGLPHTYSVESGTARLLGLGIPAGFEQFFLATGRPAPEHALPPAMEEPPDLQRLIPAAHAAGCDILGPPMKPSP